MAKVAFLFVEGGLVVELGAHHHKLPGADQEKMLRLQSLVRDDFAKARRFPLPWRYLHADSITGVRRVGVIRYEAQVKLMKSNPLSPFEEVLTWFSSGRRPIACITAVFDGVLHATDQENSVPLTRVRTGYLLT
jgi:hypothetical protein